MSSHYSDTPSPDKSYNKCQDNIRMNRIYSKIISIKWKNNKKNDLVQLYTTVIPTSSTQQTLLFVAEFQNGFIRFNEKRQD